MILSVYITEICGNESHVSILNPSEKRIFFVWGQVEFEKLKNNQLCDDTSQKSASGTQPLERL